jgi:hypothetical protein
VLEEIMIHPSSSPYSSMVIIVLQKQGSWIMCPNFCTLKKMIMKDTFSIPITNYLLDEPHRLHFFTKLDVF